MQRKTCKYFLKWIISLLVLVPASSLLRFKLLHFLGLLALEWNISNKLPLCGKKKKKPGFNTDMQSIASANALLSTCSAPHSSLSVWQISKAWWFHHKQHFPQHLPLMYQGLESGGKKKKRKEKTCKIIHIHSQKLADHRSDKRTSHSWQKVLKSERGHDVKRCPSCILKPLFFFFY